MVDVYEAVDGDPPPLREAKIAAIEVFGRGGECFHRGDRMGARASFDHTLRICPGDTVARVYLDRRSGVLTPAVET
ncbi:MAG: hypothetical protein HYV63_34410 [Candidatus Schekmanbacteria bacterium]|nr:hypothetical protein [Candidatus Schekmanbacteria bacterium]